MKARVEAGALAKALKAVAPSVGRQSDSITRGVHVETTKAGITVTATDLATTMTTDIVDGAAVGAKGAFVAPHGMLSRCAGAIKTGAIDLEVAGDELTITQGTRVTGTLRLLPVANWPRVNADRDEWGGYDLDADTVDRLRRVARAASTDASRAAQLTALTISDGWAFATDSYRLHATEVPDLDVKEPLIIPAAPLVAVLADAADGCRLDIDPRSRHVAVTTGRTTWGTQLIGGEPIRWRNLVPTNPPRHFTADRAELLDALRLVAVMPDETSSSGGKTHVRPVIIRAADGEATLTCSAADVGLMSATIDVDSDIDFDFAFNPALLRSALECTAADEITMRMTDHLKPAIIESDGLLLLCMPVRVGL